MSELEDLRGRIFGWKFDPFHRSRIVIECEGTPAGSLDRRNLWPVTYQAEFAGVTWHLAGNLVGFANSPLDIATIRRKGDEVAMLIDGTTSYRLCHEDHKRTIWRDEHGTAVVALSRSTLSKNQFRRDQLGTVRILSSSSLEHAPILVLVGILRSSPHGLWSRDFRTFSIPARD